MSDHIDLSRITVLVIDDEAFMRDLIVRVLREVGVVNVETARDGSNALAIVTRPGTSIDVILCDLEMPKMNGLEFVRQLRSSHLAPNPKVPVLIVTGHSEEGNVREAVQLGINGFLVKPISKKALEQRIKKALSSQATDPNKLD